MAIYGRAGGMAHGPGSSAAPRAPPRSVGGWRGDVSGAGTPALPSRWPPRRRGFSGPCGYGGRRSGGRPKRAAFSRAHLERAAPQKIFAASPRAARINDGMAHGVARPWWTPLPPQVHDETAERRGHEGTPAPQGQRYRAHQPAQYRGAVRPTFPLASNSLAPPGRPYRGVSTTGGLMLAANCQGQN